MTNEEHARRPSDLSRDDAPWRFITREWLLHSDGTNKPVYTYYAEKDGVVQAVDSSRKLSRLLHASSEHVLNLRDGEKRTVGPYTIWREYKKGGAE